MKFDYKTTLKLITSAVILILIACAVSLITLIFGGSKGDIFVDKTEESDSQASTVTLTETPDYGQNYVNNIIFLGDTTIAGLVDSAVLNDGSDTNQVWSGKDGDLPLDFSIDKAAIIYPETGKEIPISTAAENKKPDYILITLGISNGVSYCTEESFKAYYGKLITVLEESSPDTKIILQSVLPISKKYEKSTSGISSDKIEIANQWIVEIAENHGVRYLDTASALMDKNGYLKTEFDSGDGLHLSTYGYNTMLNYIRTHGYK